MTSFSTNHIDYLQRNFMNLQVTGDARVLFKGIRNHNDIRLLQVQGLSRFWQDSDQKALASRQLMADLFAGLHAEQVPMVFMVLGTLNRINVFIGSYRDNENWATPLSRGGVIGDAQTIRGSLQSAFPGISLKSITNAEWDYIYQIMRNAPGFSVVTGTPTAKLGTEQLGVEQIERLIRGMYGRHWGYMAIAKPFSRHTAIRNYNDGLNELREVTNAQTATSDNPIAADYAELIKRYLARQAVGKTSGLWRVSCYCFGADSASYLQVRAVTQAVFGGEESLPDPLRVVDCLDYSLQIAHLGQLVLPSQQSPPGKIKHLYEYASVLNSNELATLAHLPQEEMPGYAVQDYARFDVSPPDLTQIKPSQRLQLGQIMDRGQQTGNEYTINLDHLTRHGLVVGVTGSGKTNTAFHLLKKAWQQGTPFLVVESVKAEYRQLLDSKEHPQVGSALRVFTLGDERIAPFRLNPFQVLPGVPVQTHIDHLKAVFNASFAMYGPMPQVLEQCINAVYEARGWDMATGKNRRGDHPQAYPTLTDLYYMIDEVVESLEYGQRITPELKAALKVRVNSLRIGGKGLMLDTPLSVPIETLLAQPTVLELQGIGDDDEKSFIMGLIWIFLYEYYRANPALNRKGSRLRHVTLVEEAHRLLMDIPVTGNTEVANSRGKAVETFCHMLSEIRAYGEGMLIADQIPVRLAADAIKNTSLKIMHRLVSEEDRLVMGGAMNLDEAQLRYITTLGQGEAAIYAEGNDRAYLVHVPLSKDKQAAEDLLVISPDATEINLLDSGLGDDIRLLDDYEIEIEMHNEDNLVITFEDDEPEVSISTADENKTEPVLQIDVPTSKPSAKMQAVDDQRLKTHMADTFYRQAGLQAVFQPLTRACPVCAGPSTTFDPAPCLHRALAQQIAAQPDIRAAFARYALTCVQQPGYIQAGLKEVRRHILRHLPHAQPEAELLKFILRLLTDDYFRELGDAYQWPYTQIEALQISFQAALEQIIPNPDDEINVTANEVDLGDFQNQYRALCRRSFDPYPECSQICADGLCVYRFALAPLIRQPWLDRRYQNAFSQTEVQRKETLRQTAQKAIRRIIADEAPETVKQQAGACFLIQKAYDWPDADEMQRQRAANLGVKALFPDIAINIE